MRSILLFLLLTIGDVIAAYAISKEEFLKLPHDKRRDFPTVVGISTEYAIPREEYMKLSFETRRAIGLEQGREIIQYALNNFGKKQKELDVSRLYILTMSGDVSHYAEDIIDYLQIAGIYNARCENHFKAAKYYHKDYLEWKKHEQGQPALWRQRGGDEEPLSAITYFYEDYHLYKDWDALYADYNDFWWKKYAEGECKQLSHPGPDCAENWLKNSADYQDFLKEWEEIRRKAKTTKPKPLSKQVQIHEDFYSSNMKKVLGAVEYYRKNNVRFMIEKAAKHKNPVVAKKAKEYLDNWGAEPAAEKQAEQPVEDKKEAQPAPETR